MVKKGLTNIKNILYIIFLTIIIGYILLFILNKYLSKITINIPKQKIYLNVDEETKDRIILQNSDIIENYENNNNNNLKNINQKRKENIEDIKEEKEQIEKFETFENRIINEDEIFSHKIEKQQDEFEFKGFDKYDVSLSGVEMESYYKNLCLKYSDDENCFNDYGPMNYKHPKDMDKIEKQIFRKKYPKNMTLQDYVNWLEFNKNEQSKLSYCDLKNLNKINKKIKLTYEDMNLSKCKNNEEYNLDQYYKNLYENMDPQKSLDTYPLKGYNYDIYF